MKFKEQSTILEQYPANVIIENLAPYLNEQRIQRIDQVIQNRLHSIHLAIESPSDINNAFAAIRTSEALGVGNVHIIAAEGTTPMAKNITQGALYWVDIHYYPTLAEFLEYAASQSLTLAAGTMNAATPLHDISIDQPLCILIGNEQRGLSPAAQEACAIHYTIPMVGMSQSLNLSVSAAISLYDTTQRKREQLGTAGDITGCEQHYLRAKYYLNSVSPRLARALFADHQ